MNKRIIKRKKTRALLNDLLALGARNNQLQAEVDDLQEAYNCTHKCLRTANNEYAALLKATKVVSLQMSEDVISGLGSRFTLRTTTPWAIQHAGQLHPGDVERIAYELAEAVRKSVTEELMPHARIYGYKDEFSPRRR